jgi:hypothetical protein
MALRVPRRSVIILSLACLVPHTDSVTDPGTALPTLEANAPVDGSTCKSCRPAAPDGCGSILVA